MNEIKDFLNCYKDVQISIGLYNNLLTFEFQISSTFDINHSDQCKRVEPALKYNPHVLINVHFITLWNLAIFT